MYLIQYLLKRVTTWYNDKFYQQFSNLEDISQSINVNYVKEGLIDKIYDQVHYSDLRNNICYIKFQYFENIWIKIIYKDEINLEIITYIDEKEIPIFKGKKKEINNELFYNLITTKHPRRYWVNNDEENLSNWEKRELNYQALYYFSDRKLYLNFDLTTFHAKEKIELNIVKLREFNNQIIKGEKSKILFFKALKNNDYIHLLNQYCLCLGGFNEKSHYKYFLNLFEDYSINSNHIDILNIRNIREIINQIIENTEYVFNYEKHKNSFYYENLIKQIKNKNLSTYFMFLRLSILNKMDEIPIEVIELIDDDMLMDYEKITIAISKINKNNYLSNSYFYMDDNQKKLELRINCEENNEDFKKILYSCIRMGSNSPYNENNNNLSNTILNLIKTNLLSVNNLEEAMHHINVFNHKYNLKKLKLKCKLENKLKIKSQKSKVEKI